jgi:prephenate dehydrogenase
MAAAVRDFTRSNEQQTNVMRDMQKEMRALSEAYARLDERFNAIYDGPERRQKPR